MNMKHTSIPQSGKIHSTSFKNVLDGLNPSGNYKHLQIILSKNNDRSIGQHYLVVSSKGFGLYQLLDVDYINNEVHMKLKDISTGKVTETHFNVNDDTPPLLLVSWSDIVKIVRDTEL